MKLEVGNITLEKVKESNYWELIALLVWNHYREERHQDESKISFSERYIGKSEDGFIYDDKWNNPDYFQEGYTRTLNSVRIIFKRTDYITRIHIGVENGSVHVIGERLEGPERVNYNNYNYLRVSNWMLEHGFYKLTNND